MKKGGTFRLKGRELYEAHKPHASLKSISDEAKIAYGTVYRWVKEQEPIDNVQTDQLFSFLINGLGLTREQVAEMRVKDLFDYMPPNGEAAE